MTGRRPHKPVAGIARLLQFAVLSAGSLLSTGCLHRRMTIATDPPGAQVLVDGVEQGPSPVSLDFTYYGTREITLIKDGYETQTVMQKVRTPWYQIVPLDFVTDNFLPFRVTNRHQFLYHMHPKRHQPEQEFLNRGNAFRSESHIGQ